MVKIVVARYNESLKWALPMINNVIVYNKGKDDLTYIPEQNIVRCENVGREGGTYVKHIIDNYDNLDDYIIFLQGDPVAHIFPNNRLKSYSKIWETLNEEKKYNYKDIGTLQVPVKTQEFRDYTSGIPSLYLKNIPPLNSNVILYFIEKSRLEKTKKTQLCDKIKENKDEMIQMYQLSKILELFNIEEPLRGILFSLYDVSKITYYMKNYTYGSGALFIVSKQQILNHSKEYWTELYSTLLQEKPAAGYGLEKMWKYLLG